MFTELRTAKGKTIFVNAANITSIEAYNNTATSIISFGQGRAVAVKGTPGDIVRLIQAPAATQPRDSSPDSVTGKVSPSVPMEKYERAVLLAALADIENLAAPTNIDAVCAVLGTDVASFAKRGSAGMRSDIESAIANRQAAPARDVVRADVRDHISDLADHE